MSNVVNSVHSDVTDLYSGASSLSAMGLSGPSPTSLPSNALEKRFFCGERCIGQSRIQNPVYLVSFICLFIIQNNSGPFSFMKLII